MLTFYALPHLFSNLFGFDLKWIHLGTYFGLNCVNVLSSLPWQRIINSKLIEPITLVLIEVNIKTHPPSLSQRGGQKRKKKSNLADAGSPQKHKHPASTLISQRRDIS